MEPGRWPHDAVVACLMDRFGGPVHVEKPHVDWDSRAVCRATLAGGRRTVVKVDRLAERHHREVTGLRAAWAAGAPVPEILFSGRREHWLLVLAEIPTRTSLADGAPAWRAAGAAARRLHSAAIPPGLPMFCDGGDDWTAHLLGRVRAEAAHAVERALLTRGEADAVGRHAARAFASAGPLRAPVLLHGDLQARHVLVGEAGVTLVDFGDAGWGDAVLDLVVLAHWYPERTGEILDGYGADTALRARFAALREVYSLWRHLFVSRWYYENSFERQRSAAAARRVLEEAVLGPAERHGHRGVARSW